MQSLRVLGLGFRVHGLGCGVSGLGCVDSVRAVGALQMGGAPTYRALASACSPTPTILN